MPIGETTSGNVIPSLQYDIEATSQFKLFVDESAEVELQFPPKITSDSKAANWKETWMASYEEQAIYMGAHARQVNIELFYVIWGTWDINKIAVQVRKIKSHLYTGVVGGSSGANIKDALPFITVTGWQILPEECTLRVHNISIEYSREMVGTGGDIWPLQTKISIDSKLMTRGVSVRNKDTNIKEGNFDSGDLQDKPPFEWY